MLRNWRMLNLLSVRMPDLLDLLGVLNLLRMLDLLRVLGMWNLLRVLRILGMRRMMLSE